MKILHGGGWDRAPTPTSLPTCDRGPDLKRDKVPSPLQVDDAPRMADGRWMIDVVLLPDRERSPRRRHPWILSGAVARVLEAGSDSAGAWARVVSAEGETLGYGHYSPCSQIRVRILVFGKEPPSDELLCERVSQAVQRRARDPLVGETDALRLVNSEGDGLPGLVVDRYGDVVVMKLGSAGMSVRRELLAKALREATSAPSGFERADAAAARREGVAVHEGPLWGKAPEPRMPIHERGRRYLVDLVHGQKTGFYLDQRDSRDLMEALAPGRRVLDLFAYTGGFSVAGRARLPSPSSNRLQRPWRWLARMSPRPPQACKRRSSRPTPSASFAKTRAPTISL
jgi:hypothetical protein